METLIVSSLFNKTPPPGYGGVERFVDSLATSLVRGGENVTVARLAGSQGGNYSAVDVQPGAVCSSVMKAVKELRPDVIHLNHKDSDLIEALAAQHTPVVITLHSSLRSSSSWLDIMHTAPSHFHFTGISKSMCSRAQELYKKRFPNHPVPVVHNTGYGLNVADISRYDQGISGDYYLYLGVIARYKAVMSIVEAFADLDHPLVVAGPCNQEGERAYFNQMMGIIGQCSHIAYRQETANDSEKYGLLSGSKGVVIATGYDPLEKDCHEAFGLIMLEANAMGKPVLGYSQGNITDFVVDGVNGFKFTDTSQLGEITSRLEAQDLSHGCRLQAKAHDISVVSGNYLQLFSQVND